MSTEITKKQAILLAVLGVILVVVCYFNFLLKPVLNDISEYNQQAEDLQAQYDNLVVQSNSYDQNIASLEGWAEKNKEETSKLYPLSDPQRIDNILTRVVSMFDAQIKSLSISELNQYYVDGEGNLITADPALVEASQEGASSAEAAASGYTATGEYRRDFTYTIEGNYEDMVQMINFVNNLSFLGISNFTFQSIASSQETAGLNVFEDHYSFTITVTAYMFNDPLKKAEDVQTDAEEIPAEEIEAV